MAKVKVRVAVAVDKHGKWNALGYAGCDDAFAQSLAAEVVSEGERHYWLEAELDIPEEQIVNAQVTEV